MIRHLLVAALVLSLAACGFHLRNALVLPPDLGPVKVQARDRYSPLAESLAQALTRAGAEPATADTPAPSVLDIRAEKWDQNPVSVDERGRAQEFSLRYAVVFELRAGDGGMIVPRQAIELSRDYISVPAASIGTEDEREILEKELRREMTASILRRIDAVARKQGGVALDDEPELEVQATDAARAAMEAAAAMSPPVPEADDAQPRSGEPAPAEPAIPPDPEPSQDDPADAASEDDGPLDPPR